MLATSWLRNRSGTVAWTPAQWAFLLGVWFLCHPYEGLIHDGILYAGQAMRHLHPGVFDADLFFVRSSQDDFTAFGRVYGALAGLLGLPLAGVALYALGQVLWLFAALAWIRHVAPKIALAGAACLVALRYAYSTGGHLELAESFVTARLMAEPLALGGLFFVLRGRTGAGGVLLLVAAAIHPLVAAPALGVLAITWSARRLGWRRTLGLSTLALATIAGAAQLWPPRMDGEWLALVQARNDFAVPSGWSVDGWARWATVLVMLLSAARAAPTRFADLWRALALTGATGVALSLLAFEARWAALIQAQAWRAMWPAVWFAPLAVISAFLAVAPQQVGLRRCMLVMIPAFALGQQTAVPGAALLAAAATSVVGIAVHRGRCGVPRDHSSTSAFVAGALCVLALAAGALVLAAAMVYADPAQPIDRTVFSVGVRAFGWIAAGAIAWWAAGASRPGATRPGGGEWKFAMGAPGRLAVWAGAALVVAALTIDARPPVAVEAERLHRGGLSHWRATIPEDAQVFWPERLRYVWFGLLRSSYVSFAQGAGALFGRETAFEAHRRRAVVGRISARDGDFSLGSAPALGRPPTADSGSLRAVCAGDTRLDFVVLAAEIPGGLGHPYREAFSGIVYRLYACADFR